MNFSARTVLGRLDPAFRNRLLESAQETRLAAGDILCEAGEAFDSAYLIVTGRLQELTPSGRAQELNPGDIVDELQLLTGGTRAQTLRALEPTRLLRFEPDRFRSLVAADESLLETLSSLFSERLRKQQLSRVLQRLFGPLDDAVQRQIRQQVDWLELEPGEILFRQADPGDALYALIDGRMAAFSDGDAGPVFLNEILPGETIGEIAIVTGADRSATVKATKRSLLVRLARSDFDAIAELHPIVYKTFAQVLVTWLQRGHDPNRRICIVGAGPAELSAAYFLKQRGYSRVVVLEANQRVGGKCCSPTVGDVVVEAGALGATGSYRIAGGYEGLWRSVAASLDVRLGNEVVRVERGSMTRLRTRLERLECDVLLIASPLDQALTFLDASPAEEQLFSRIRYNSYYATVCSTQGLPNASISIHPLPGPGVTCLLARGWARPETTVAYAYGAAEEFSLEDVAGRLERDIHNLGGRLVSIDNQFAWRYFPHVGPEDMAAGYFDRIEALQGKQNTYYAGSLLSFETVEDVVAYSKKLVERFF